MPASAGERGSSRSSGACQSASQLQISWHFVPASGETGTGSSSPLTCGLSERRETIMAGSSTAAAAGCAACKLTRQNMRNASNVFAIISLIWRMRIGQGRIGRGCVANGTRLDVKVPSPRGAKFGRLATVKLQSVEKSRPVQLAQQCLVGMNHNGNPADFARKFLQPRRDLREVHGAFRPRIKVEPERVDARFDRGKRIFFASEAANFYSGATAIEPAPQTVRNGHISSACDRGPA